MNAAKKLRKLIVSGLDDLDVLILTDLARSLAMGETFVLARLNELSMRNFDLALELINDWRFDHHIPARRRLAEALSPKAAPPESVTPPADQSAPTDEVATPAADAVETAPAAEDLFTEATPTVAPAAKKPRTSKAKAKRPADKAD
mgnify:CR=1 FL=1|jgi:hypothetical protein